MKVRADENSAVVSAAAGCVSLTTVGDEYAIAQVIVGDHSDFHVTVVRDDGRVKVEIRSHAYDEDEVLHEETFEL